MFSFSYWLTEGAFVAHLLFLGLDHASDASQDFNTFRGLVVGEHLGASAGAIRRVVVIHTSFFVIFVVAVVLLVACDLRLRFL